MNELALQIATGAEPERKGPESRGEALTLARQDAILRLNRKDEDSPSRYRFDGQLLFSR
jgi:hypothetical protein